MISVNVNAVQENKQYSWEEIQTKPGVYKPQGMSPGTFLVVRHDDEATTNYQATMKFILISKNDVSTNVAITHSNWANMKFEYVGSKIDLTIEVTNAY